MSIFRRRRDSDQSRPADPAFGGATDEDLGGQSDGDQATEPAVGPFDVSEVDGPEGRLDLGALWLTGVPGMELRLELDQESQSVMSATAVHGESAVQLQAFAAPRSSGVWDEIREEIRVSILGQGGTADEAVGPLGRELRTRMPQAGPDGRTVFAPARFLGVDGPRWFLRAVFSGRAAIDEGEAETLLDVVRQTVVVRGETPMAPRELLPLSLPKQSAPQGAQQPEDSDHVGAGHDLNPFERGPEITEVR